MTFKIHELAAILKTKTDVEADATFSSISTDTRTIKRGECFVAIKGENFDGHDYVPLAFEKGAACAIVNENYQSRGKNGFACIRVPDTIAAMGELARAYRRQMKCKIIAITGSAGKTTTRQIIHHVLSKKFKCHTAVKSFNNNIGLPLTILGIEPEDDIAIVELGTNHPGEIATLAAIAEPDIAIITNVYEAHIEHFGSVEAIIREKVSIAGGLKASSPLIINQDIAGLEEYCRNQHITYSAFGTSSNSVAWYCQSSNSHSRAGSPCHSPDVLATDIELKGLSSSFKIGGVRMELPLPGNGNVYNALAAFAVAARLGFNPTEFGEALKDLGGVSMRLEPVRIGQALLISDCYNANPGSMKNALELLSHLGRGSDKRLVFVCGPMLELGEHSDQAHSELGRQAAKSGVALLLAVGKFAAIVADSARNEGTGIETHCFENTAELVGNISPFVRPDDIILVKGSRAAKLEMVVEKLKGLLAQPELF
jgi:UDP-N-acetylmuramoyl-tripeptide--D-alanyl-D-alanine ligase